jgi:AraC-like DNA-binding protein
MTKEFFLADDKLIPAWLQPVVILDLVAARGIDPKQILNGTSLFPIDIPFIGCYISARHFDQLLINAERLWIGHDFAFQLGHRIANHGLGPLPGTIDKSITPADFLALLSQFQQLIGPTLTSRLMQINNNNWFYLFRPAAGMKMIPATLECEMTIISHLAKHNCLNVEIDCFFTSSTPIQIENFHTHITQNCYFNAPFNGIQISSKTPSEATIKSNPNMVKQVAKEQCMALCNKKQYFITALEEMLQADADSLPNLQHCASNFGISPATFKRRLREHSISFQMIWDALRSEQAIVELLVNGTSIDVISEKLHFHDSSNFRRAFKRWTGTSPTLLKNLYKELENAFKS